MATVSTKMRQSMSDIVTWCVKDNALSASLTFKRRIKSHLPFAGIIRRSPYSPHFQDKG